MKKFFIILLSVCLLGIGAIKLPSNRFGVFSPYVNRFIQAGQSVGVDVDMTAISITFLEELPHDAAGICHMATKTVVILEPYWNSINDSEKETLIFHELGHCVLGRQHENNALGGYPHSIMYFANTIGEDQIYYKAHRQEYINELFGK